MYVCLSVVCMYVCNILTPLLSPPLPKKWQKMTKMTYMTKMTKRTMIVLVSSLFQSSKINICAIYKAITLILGSVTSLQTTMSVCGFFHINVQISCKCRLLLLLLETIDPLSSLWSDRQLHLQWTLIILVSVNLPLVSIYKFLGKK